MDLNKTLNVDLTIKWQISTTRTKVSNTNKQL